MKTFRQLYEDAFGIADLDLDEFSSDARPFFIYKNKLYLGDLQSIHEDVWDLHSPRKGNWTDNMMQCDGIGRIWEKHKVIAFHELPDDIEKMVSLFKKNNIDLTKYKFDNIYIDDGEPVVSYKDFKNHFKEIESDYTGIHL